MCLARVPENVKHACQKLLVARGNQLFNGPARRFSSANDEYAATECPSRRMSHGEK